MADCWSDEHWSIEGHRFSAHEEGCSWCECGNHESDHPETKEGMT